MDDYIAEEYIKTKKIGGRIAWFRPIYVSGLIIFMWWSPETHGYKVFGNTKKEKDIAQILEDHMRIIAKITGLELFSTEFAIRRTGKIIATDYANQPIDLNIQSLTKDGIPDNVLKRVVKQLID